MNGQRRASFRLELINVAGLKHLVCFVQEAGLENGFCHFISFQGQQHQQKLLM